MVFARFSALSKPRMSVDRQWRTGPKHKDRILILAARHRLRPSAVRSGADSVRVGLINESTTTLTQHCIAKSLWRCRLLSTSLLALANFLSYTASTKSFGKYPSRPWALVPYHQPPWSEASTSMSISPNVNESCVSSCPWNGASARSLLSAFVLSGAA